MSLKELKMWNRYNVEVELITRLVGGIPVEPKLVEAWIGSKMKDNTDAEREKIKNATIAEIPVIADGEAGWNTFKRDVEGRLIYEGRCMKAAFKEAANVLRDMLNKATSKEGDKKLRFTSFRSKVAEQIFVVEEQIVLTRKGQPFTEPDGREEKPIHVMTAMGQRDALKRVDFVGPGTVVKFEIKVLNNGLVDKEVLDILFEYMAQNGIGAERSQGSGQFKLLKLEEKK